MILNKEDFKKRQTTPQQAVLQINKGRRIFIGSGAASPQTLEGALIQEASHFRDNEIIHLLTLGKADYVDEKFSESFRHNAFFIGANVREGVREGLADYTPIFLSEIPNLFRKGGMPIDVALIMVSPPDQYGYCSFGINVDIVKEACKQARLIIAEINPHMPFTMGDSFLHISEIDFYVETDYPLPELPLSELDKTTDLIGLHISWLIEDGATLQMGIGNIPNAVLKYIKDKKDIGVHTEMFSDGIIDLVEAGTITNKLKGFHDGKIVTSFCLGTERLYRFVDRNPAIEFHPSDFVNNPFYIAKNNKMIAINSALEVDLTGQVCADSMGHNFYSGIGGQVDFIRGAALSNGGKPIIALPSTAKGGKISRIVPNLNQGAGVVTTRGDVHYVVTEFGIAYLHGKSVRQRAIELLQVAHPDFKEELLSSLKERKYVFSDQKVDTMGDLSPRKYKFNFSLKDNRQIFFRPVRPSDERMLQDFFYSHTTETIYNRYFYVESSMGHKRAQALANINFSQDIALIGFFGRHESRIVVAIGRYYLNPTQNSAEVAFVVHEDFQEYGIGTHLMTQLIEIGRERGVQKFTAQVLTSNTKMLRLFNKIVPGLKRRIEGNIVEISFQLKDVPATFCYLSPTA